MAITKTVGGGGDFKAELMSGVQVDPISAPKTITVNCPSNKRIRLSLFCVGSSTATLANVTLAVGSKTLFSGTLGSGGNSSYANGGFTVGHYGSAATSGTQVQSILGDFNENIVMTFATALVGWNVVYSYEVGA